MTLSPSARDQLNKTLTSHEIAYLLLDSQRITRHVIPAITDRPDNHDLRILATPEVTTALDTDFLTLATLGDLTDADNNTVTYKHGTHTLYPCVITETRMLSIRNPGEVRTHEITDNTIITNTLTTTTTEWKQATPQTFRFPTLTEIKTTLTHRFTEEIANDFISYITVGYDTLLDTPSVTRTDVALLFAAKHHLTLYDISKWADYTEFGASATFSRRKTHLEELGIRTSPQQVGVGRPRLQLSFTEDITGTSLSHLTERITTNKTSKNEHST